MAKFQQINNFSAGTNLDLDALRIPENAVVFFKNLTQSVSPNASAPDLAGSNSKVTKPIEGNTLLPITLASGANYCIGTYSSEQTNEMYFFVYNNSNNHSIWVVRGDTGVVQKVYQNSLLNFQLDPQYFISQGRCTLELRSYVNPTTDLETNYKFLIFTDNFNSPKFISVEDSIATISYTSPAPYFAGAGTLYIEETLITLGLPVPLKCMGLNNPVPYVPVTGSTGIGVSITGSRGIDYAPGDTFTVDGGSPLATGVVLSVNPVLGFVTSYLLTSTGEGYSISGSTATTTTSGAGSLLTLQILSLQPADSHLQNAVIRRAWQFRVKFVDVFGRESEHGIISTQYITIVGGGCITASNGLPRCLDFNFDAGNPLVNYIQIEYRLWIDGSTPVEGDWQLYDTIAKWNNEAGLQWYQRDINPALIYNSSTNVITYTFCGDKESTPIPTAETARTENGVPRFSSAVQSINKRILLANNVRGFQPIDPVQLKKIAVFAKDPTSTPCPAAPLRAIVVYSNIYRPLGGSTVASRTGIYRLSHGKYVWGNTRDGTGADDCGDYSSFAMDQVFGDQTNPGFIMYMAGMSGSMYYAIGQQGNLNPATGVFTPVPIAGSGSFPQIAVQQYIFYVPAGKYLLRMASHKTTVASSDYQQTSTYVLGYCPVSDLTLTASSRESYATTPYKELEVDCTSGNVVFNQPTDPVFIILDIGQPLIAAAIDGYLYEQINSDVPVEMNPVYITGSTGGGSLLDAWGSFFTDHNGFYFATSQTSAFVVVQVFADLCDGTGINDIFQFLGVAGGITHGDGTGTPPGACEGVNGYWGNRMYIADGVYIPSFPECARRRINQRVGLCSEHTTGIPGVPIVMTKGGTAITDPSGNSQIIAHNRYTYLSSIGSNPAPYLGASVPNFGASPGNQDKLIFSQKGGCQWTICADCTTSMADITVSYISCCSSIMDCSTCRITDEADVYVNVSGVNIYGIQTGGRYPVGVVLHTGLGDHTFVQKIGYADAANLNDASYRSFALQSIGYQIASDFTVPTVFKYMTFVVAKNALFTNFFSWAADWIQFIDSTGQTNRINPTAIRIYYGSLIEYNKAYNFSTETNWSFNSVDQNGNVLDTPVEGDVVQFIMNGDGAWLESVKSAPITYNKTGLFFTIDFTNDLLSLTNGCLFRVIRPSKIIAEDGTFYEQCLTITLDNDGTVPSGQRIGALPYFDSYLLTRLLPVPLFEGQTGPIVPGGTPVGSLHYSSTGTTGSGTTTGTYVTNNEQNSNYVIIMQTTDANVAFPFYFESPSPSDFWGNHVANRGRIFIVNPYEQQERFGTEIALSDAISDGGVFNGLGYFENIPSVTTVHFDHQGWGNITCVLVETSVAMVICNADHFITRFNLQQTRVDDSGNLIAQNQYGPFGAPDRKQGQNFGCIPENINTIARYAGTVVWLDAKGHLIFSNFSDALPVEMGGYQGYLLNKIAAANISNLNSDNGRTFFMGAIDPKTMEYFLTSFNYLFIGAPSYINTQDAPNIAVNETLMFDLSTGIMKGSPAFTPEYYGMLPGYFSQKNFLSFKGGKPYLHHATLAGGLSIPAFANFYGTQSPCRITVVCNVGPEKVKRYFSITVSSGYALLTGISGTAPQPVFYSDIITTSKNQLSRLKPLRWEQKDKIWYTEFLCDINTPVDPNLPLQTGINKLLDGDPLQGTWCQVSLVTNAVYAGEYFEVTSVIISGNGVEKSG